MSVLYRSSTLRITTSILGLHDPNTPNPPDSFMFRFPYQSKLLFRTSSPHTSRPHRSPTAVLVPRLGIASHHITTQSSFPFPIWLRLTRVFCCILPPLFNSSRRSRAFVMFCAADIVSLCPPKPHTTSLLNIAQEGRRKRERRTHQQPDNTTSSPPPPPPGPPASQSPSQ